MKFSTAFEDLYHIQRSFIDPDSALELGLQYKQYLEENNFGNDTQVENCRATSDFFPFWQILVDKNKEIGDTIGQPILPSYTYARMYLHGGELVPHVDMDCCELNATVHLNGDQPWPIWLETKRGPVSVELGPGDALFYLGNKTTHWREPYEGEWYTNFFLFYVLSNGPNRHLLFDVTKLSL